MFTYVYLNYCQMMQFQSCYYLTPALCTSWFPVMIPADAEWAKLTLLIQKKINQKSKEIPMQSKCNLTLHTHPAPKIATLWTSEYLISKAFIKAWDRRAGNAVCSSDLSIILMGRDLRRSSCPNFCPKQINLPRRWQDIICLLPEAVKVKWPAKVKEEGNDA